MEQRGNQHTLAGVADKGLFITTGGFTKDAEREAVRDGTPAIDLVDGIDLCILLKDLGLGVGTGAVEVVKPRPEFLGPLRRIAAPHRSRRRSWSGVL